MDSLKSKKFRDNPEKALNEMKLTRRELFELGAIPFAVKMLVPSTVQLIAQLVSSNANAQAIETNKMPIPFLNINLSGGASLDGNVIPYKNIDGQSVLLSNYQSLGMGLTSGTNGVEASQVSYLGTKFHRESSILAGLKEILGDQPPSSIRITSMCVDTTADTGNVIPLRPRFDVASAVEKAGRKGLFISDLQMHDADTTISASMSISSFKDEDPQSRTQVKSLKEIMNAVSLSGYLAEKKMISSVNYNYINEKQKNSLIKLIKNIANLQIGKEQIKMNQAYAELENLLSGQIKGSDLVNPFNNPKAVSAFGLTTNSPELDQAMAGTVHACLNGYSSHGLILFGGYDYHTPSTRNESNAKDLLFGRRLGRILKFAVDSQKPLFIFVTTDGSNRVNSDLFSDTFGGQWSSDSRSSIQLMVAYHPDGIEQTKIQIGSYMDNANTDKTTLVGSREDYASAAVLANYLSVSGLLDIERNQFSLYSQIAPSTITTDRLHEVVSLFKKGG